MAVETDLEKERRIAREEIGDILKSLMGHPHEHISKSTKIAASKIAENMSQDLKGVLKAAKKAEEKVLEDRKVKESNPISRGKRRRVNSTKKDEIHLKCTESIEEILPSKSAHTSTQQEIFDKQQLSILNLLTAKIKSTALDLAEKRRLSRYEKEISRGDHRLKVTHK